MKIRRLAARPALDLREPFNRYSFPIRAAHHNEFERLIASALQLGEKRIGFLYSPNPNGEKHLANVRKLPAAKGETTGAGNSALMPKQHPKNWRRKF